MKFDCVRALKQNQWKEDIVARHEEVVYNTDPQCKYHCSRE